MKYQKHIMKMILNQHMYTERVYHEFRFTIVIFPNPNVWSSASKSSTSSFVSSVPFRLPTAHTSLVLLQRMRHTTPPLPPLSSDTRFRRKSPVRRSQIFTVPSSDDVITKRLLNCRQVTALWCLLEPENILTTDNKLCSLLRLFYMECGCILY